MARLLRARRSPAPAMNCGPTLAPATGAASSAPTDRPHLRAQQAAPLQSDPATGAASSAPTDRYPPRTAVRPYSPTLPPARPAAPLQIAPT
ncbi:MAG: hypothetical protein M3Z04_24210 [Chloroflexota bacterium]|nr:hypothetical protein [Chloroflexota bacterium]